jgi:hypothetical protein
MNRIHGAIVLLVLICALLFTGVVAFGEQEPLFSDANLEAVIREAIGKPTGDLVPSDLLGLTGLKAANREIINLEGMQYCVDITWLHLGETYVDDSFVNSNQISDLTPLAGLTRLTQLYLWGNQIRDITPLSGLTNLMVVDLEGNQISDLSPLAGLTQFTWLDLA